MGKTAGSVGAIGWLRARGFNLPTTERWHAEIALGVTNTPPPTDFDETTETRFHLDIYSEEWGLYFCHGGRASWIRVTDLAFVHGRDDFQLLVVTPPLRDIGVLMRHLEKQHQIAFQRQHATVKTNVPRLEPAIRAWLTKL